MTDAAVIHQGLVDEMPRRRRALARALEGRGLDSAVLATEGNAMYFTGYETTYWINKSKPWLLVALPDRRPVVVCHGGEAISVRLDAIDVEVVEYGGPERHRRHGAVQLDYHTAAVATVLEVLDAANVQCVGLESSWHFIPGLSPSAMDLLRGELGKRSVSVGDAAEAVWAVRRPKSGWELERMRHAADVLERAHRTFSQEARIGMSERELARIMCAAAIAEGADRVPYFHVIAGAERAPLGGPTDRCWERGQMLVVDCCIQIRGYQADFNRLYASAQPTAPALKAYASLTAALCRAREQVAAGTTVAELAEILIDGHPTQFARVGHGLGLDQPEPPSLSPLDPTPLLAGELLCLEPNRGVDGVGWMVAEEEIVITDQGADLISVPFPAELPVIG